MTNFISAASQFTRHGAIGTARAAAAPQGSSLAALCKTYKAKPIRLTRSGEARSLSRARYQRAEEFLLSLSEVPGDWPNFLYRAGIVAQLALSSYLLDVGFADVWCTQHIGLQVSRSLAYANASGLDYDCAETAKLVRVLSPYWKWNARALSDSPRPDDGGFTAEEVRTLLCDLMRHVGRLTGHRSRL